MRIAVTVDPEIPVPPSHYGGIERIVDMLARGLANRRHEITVFAHRDSRTAGRLVPWPGKSSRSLVDTTANTLTLARQALSSGFDLIHSFSRVAYLLPLLPLPIPKLMTYQRKISRRSVMLGHILSRGTLQFSAISRWMMQPVEDIGRWHLVFNGVPIAAFPYRDELPADAPLVFLGRIEEIKGPHLAIEVARRTNHRLVIGGNVPDEHRAFFDAHVRPHIDGKQISYIGPVDDAQKSALLGCARALLMPILWEEPFGIVMPEAMACGTPVIGLSRGAVPEVVRDGITGFVCNDVDGLVVAVDRLCEIRRGACRAHVELTFSDTAIVERYLAVYDRMITRPRSRPERGPRSNTAPMPPP